MTFDGEKRYEDIRLNVSLEKYSTERLAEMWGEVFGSKDKNTIRREKFKEVGGDLETEDDSILEDAKITAIEGETYLIWQKKGRMSHLIINEQNYIGIQRHESGEKSVVVVRSGVDTKTGVNKQTTRRFTAIK